MLFIAFLRFVEGEAGILEQEVIRCPGFVADIVFPLNPVTQHVRGPALTVVPHVSRLLCGQHGANRLTLLSGQEWFWFALPFVLERHDTLVLVLPPQTENVL